MLVLQFFVLITENSPGSASTQSSYHSPPPALENQPFECLVTRREHEGFGFIIVSSVNKVGAVVGEFCIGTYQSNFIMSEGVMLTTTQNACCLL